MLLNKFLYIAGLCWVILLGGCATAPSISHYDQSVLNNNYWLTAGFAIDKTYFYTPRETVYNPDGTITTLVASTLKSTGSPLKPSMWDINCQDKVVRIRTLDQNGNWKLFKDWHLVDSKSVGQIVVTNLCYHINVPDSSARFITVTEDKKIPNRYYTYVWDANKNYAGANQKDKVFKLAAYDSLEKKSSWMYAIVRCSDRSYALDTSPDPAKPTWLQDAVQTSAVGYLIVQACGFKSQTQTAAPIPSNTPNNSSRQYPSTDPVTAKIDEAKTKCTQMGLKKGTEGFGTCVLRMSK